MNKVEAKKQAIQEVAELMKKYTEYVESVKDQPFTPEIREQLRSKGNIIRWLQQGLESGYYDG
jgi:DNA-binding protein H-NS